MAFHVETTAYTQAATQPFAFDGAERHNVALREVLESLPLHGANGQQFSALILNRDFAESGRSPLVTVNGFTESSYGVPCKWRAYQFAAANPDRLVVQIDLPGHGTSDKATAEQRAEVRARGAMGLIAAAQMEGLRGRFSELGRLSLGGVSLGALVALEAAAPELTERLGLVPRHYVGAEAAGFDTRTPNGLLFGFFVAERFRRRMYLPTVPDGAVLHQAYNDFEDQLKARGYTGNEHDPARAIKEDLPLIGLMIRHGVLNNGRSFSRLERLLQNNPDLTAHLVNGGLSAVVRWHKIADDVTKITDEFPGRVTWQLWPADSHGMSSTAQQPRLAAFVRQALA